MQFITKFFFVLCGALFCGLLLMQYDQRCLDFAQKSIENMFAQELHATFHGIATKVDLTRLAVTYKHVRVVPHNDQLAWQWKADELVVSLSLWPYFYEKAFGLFIKVKNLEAHSVVRNGLPTILQHVQDMTQSPPMALPLVFDGIAFTNGRIKCQSDDGRWRFFTIIQSDSGRSKTLLKSRLSLLDAALYHDDTPIFMDMKGICSSSIDLVTGKSFAQWDSTLSLKVLPPDEQESYFSGTWQQNALDVVLYNHQHTCSCVPIVCTKHAQGWHITCDGMLSLDACKKIFFNTFPEAAQGMVIFSLSGDTHKIIQGSFELQNGGYKGYQCQKIRTPFFYDSTLDVIRGLIDVSHNDQKITGAYEYNIQQNKGFCFLKNKTDLAILDNNYWTIPAGSLQCAIQKQKEKFHCSYALDCMHTKTQEKHGIQGIWVVSQKKNEVHGIFDKYTYHMFFDPISFLVKEFSCEKIGHEKTDFMQWYKKSENSYDFSMTKDFCTNIAHGFGYEISGMSAITGSLKIMYPELWIELAADAMTMRLFDMHNFLTKGAISLYGTFDSYKFTFLRLLFNFSQGTFESNQGWIQWKGGTCFDVYFPFQFYDCFLQYGQDIYGLVSGSMVYQSTKNNDSLRGFLALHSLQLKNITFLNNADHHEKMFNSSFFSNTNLDVTVLTKNLFSVMLPQLHTQGVGNFTIQGTVKNPEMHGAIVLKKGSFIFPASTLPFTQANIHFTPQQTIDPTIELYAQGRVKKYIVTVAVHGSVRSPHIFLHSVPALSEEHIISLLLTGTEQGSLSMMVPSLVMKNFENFLFGSTKRFFKDHSSYAWLLKPLEKVSFSPYFTDQSGRGGLKGLLEIEISDRLRAVLEKNLSLSEDIAVEIEYIISDDTSFKLCKDERGDIGAEVEMRFKF